MKKRIFYDKLSKIFLIETNSAIKIFNNYLETIENILINFTFFNRNRSKTESKFYKIIKN